MDAGSEVATLSSPSWSRVSEAAWWVGCGRGHLPALVVEVVGTDVDA